MKVICDSMQLSRAMAMVARALPSKAVMPVLEGVHIHTESSSLVLSCTDLNMGIQCAIPAQVDAPGDAVLQGKLFAEVARRLPAGNVTINVSDKEGEKGAVLTAPGLRTRLFVMDAEDFPALPNVENGTPVKLSAKVLKELVRQCAFSVALDESRKILTGILLELGNGTCRMVALDGYRLAMCDAPYEGEAEGLSAVIPAQTMNRLAAIIEDEDMVDLEISKTHFGMTAAGVRMVSRLLEGDYLNYQRIIPTQWSSRFIVERDAMAEALDRASMLARAGVNNLIKLHLSSKEIIITSNSDQGEIYEELTGGLEGNEIDIAFNVRYLMDIFKCLPEGEVSLDLTTPLSPCVIRPLHGSSTYLVLPVRIYS